MIAVRPEDQFQMGETVLYVRDGIVTKICGYCWSESVGGPPQLVSYKLECGITVPVSGGHIVKYRRDPA